MLVRGQPPSRGGAAFAGLAAAFGADCPLMVGAIGEASVLSAVAMTAHASTTCLCRGLAMVYCLTYWKFSIFAVNFFAGALTIVVAA